MGTATGAFDTCAHQRTTDQAFDRAAIDCT
jgi:hypothetical protein